MKFMFRDNNYLEIYFVYSMIMHLCTFMHLQYLLQFKRAHAKVSEKKSALRVKQNGVSRQKA